MDQNNRGEIIVYQSEDGLTHVDVQFEGDTVWLTQAQLIDLYHSSKSNISEHIKHIYEDGELTEEATVRKFRTVQNEGNRQVSRDITYIRSGNRALLCLGTAGAQKLCPGTKGHALHQNCRALCLRPLLS